MAQKSEFTGLALWLPDGMRGVWATCQLAYTPVKQ